jgi:hypothetical protein
LGRSRGRKEGDGPVRKEDGEEDDDDDDDDDGSLPYIKGGWNSQRNFVGTILNADWLIPSLN